MNGFMDILIFIAKKICKVILTGAAIVNALRVLRKNIAAWRRRKSERPTHPPKYRDPEDGAS